MSPEHIIFIPGVMLVGLVVGFVLGKRAVMRELDEKRKRMKL